MVSGFGSRVVTTPTKVADAPCVPARVMVGGDVASAGDGSRQRKSPRSPAKLPHPPKTPLKQGRSTPHAHLVKGLGFGVQGPGFRVQGSGFEV